MMPRGGSNPGFKLAAGTPRIYLHALEIRLDITKAFENLDRRKLTAAAVHLGYLIALLQMSLASYAWVRRLNLNGAVGKALRPQFGSAIGSTEAVFELIVDILGLARRIRELFPNAHCSLHCDDLTMGFTHQSREVLVDTVE